MRMLNEIILVKDLRWCLVFGLQYMVVIYSAHLWVPPCL